jgi:hypothetical protein
MHVHVNGTATLTSFMAEIKLFHNLKMKIQGQDTLDILAISHKRSDIFLNKLFYTVSVGHNIYISNHDHPPKHSLSLMEMFQDFAKTWTELQKCP